MKRIISILMAAALMLSLAPAVFAEETAPEAAYIASSGFGLQYVEPVYYENGEGEPTIGVTLLYGLMGFI